ncbi:MAG: prepilin-type N-terminal cleavage/methylation domain-containing protein [Bacteriovoracaceae bacterium]|nr:prepilin-type N-terminal cleavage/methylation domain-containing protein [Bacteriovoracaceae bacterium]
MKKIFVHLRPGGKTQRGFTLVENLAALAVLAIAATVYIRMSHNLTESARDVQDTVLAENLIISLSEEIVTDSFRYPTLPTEIFDERKMSISRAETGADSSGKLSPDLFLKAFMTNKCNYRYMAYRCYNLTGGVEFSCVPRRDNGKLVMKKGNNYCSCAQDGEYNPMANLQNPHNGEVNNCRDPYEYVCFDGTGAALHGPQDYFTADEKQSFRARYGVEYPSNGSYEEPDQCSKASVWYFKSAVHDLSILRDLKDENAQNVLSPLPVYRMNFHVEYKKGTHEILHGLFFSRIVTEVNRY